MLQFAINRINFIASSNLATHADYEKVHIVHYRSTKFKKKIVAIFYQLQLII